MAKVLEFDTFMQEAKGENLTVRVGGKDYSVPPKIPAIVPLMMAAAVLCCCTLFVWSCWVCPP